MPTSVAHVTNHRTISRLRQFNEASVMRITFGNHKKPHVISQRIKKNVIISILFYDFCHTTCADNRSIGIIQIRLAK